MPSQKGRDMDGQVRRQSSLRQGEKLQEKPNLPTP